MRGAAGTFGEFSNATVAVAFTMDAFEQARKAIAGEFSDATVTVAFTILPPNAPLRGAVAAGGGS
jgi:hypothetical protein